VPKENQRHRFSIFGRGILQVETAFLPEGERICPQRMFRRFALNTDFVVYALHICSA